MQKVQLTYKFRLYPKPEHEERLLETLELCRQTYNYFLAQWNGKERIPSGTSEGLGYENPYRDWISACRIKMRGWGSPDSPAEVEPLLVGIPASSIFEAGSPLAFSRG